MNETARTIKTISPVKIALFIFALVLVFFIVIFATVSLRIGDGVLLKMKEAKLANEIIQVQYAVQSFDTEYGFYPTAPDNAAFIKILTGATRVGNRRGIAFMNVKPSDVGAKGELLDPWGTPFELSVSMSGDLHVRSAGPDKIFGTPDDEQGDTNLSGEK